MRIDVDKKSEAARPSRRRGTIVPILALVMVTMVGFLALSIDIGMLSIAKTQTQQAADLAALTASRTVNGDSTISYNKTAATTNAQNCLTYNLVLGTSLPSSQLSLTYGSYDYNQTSQTFNANYPATTGMPASAVTATVSSGSLPVAFGSAFGSQFLPSISATAQAVHRPRDIALVMDLSGSMRLGTCLGFDWYTSNRSTNNPDPLYPNFGHYSSASAVMQGPNAVRTSSYENYTLSPSNTTASTSSYSLTYVNGFYQNAAYASPLIRAFDSYTSTDGGVTWSPPTTGTPQLPPASYATVPGGDVPLFKSGSSTNYAADVKDVLGGSTTRNAAWELDGYSNYTNGSLSNAASGKSDYSTAPFNGYTKGPAYYGKTFFIWPPDPRAPIAFDSNTTTIFKQFYTDFGYLAADFSTTTTWQPLYGVFNSAATTAGDHNWPWPADNGVSLGTYLTTNVYIPGGGRKLNTTDSQYKQIMRLYNWYYAVDTNGTACDWRIRFFGTDNNTLLFNGSGSLNLPTAATYTINYNEILRWITQTTDPFPTQLRAGRVKYYGSIPTAITGTSPNFGSTDQRFWVEFIDYVLGFRQIAAGVYRDVSAMSGLGSDFTWGTIGINLQPSATQYMSYSDNAARPLSRYWFGPMAMVDYLHNRNMYSSGVANYFYMQPGDSYEAPIYTAKQAFVAAVSTMKTNHPNDWVSIATYGSPRTSVNSGVSGRFNCVRSPLGTNYNYATSSLLFPFATINADGSPNGTEITPYAADPATGAVPSADFLDTPRADGNTCFAMGLMLSYNQFAVTPIADSTLRNYTTSSPITFPTGMAGGMGRKGAQKVVVFETDGLANTSATANLVSAGTYKYYRIRYNMNSPNSSEYPVITTTGLNDPTVVSQVNSLVQQLSTDYGTSRNPFKLYAIGFGPVFQGANASSALSTLQSMQFYGGTQTSAGTALPSNQVITGTDSQMSTAMINAYTSILQNGVQIALIR